MRLNSASFYVSKVAATRIAATNAYLDLEVSAIHPV